MGDEEPVKSWKEKYHENRVMHRNIDNVDLKLKISPEVVVVGKISAGARSRGPFLVHGLKV